MEFKDKFVPFLVISQEANYAPWIHRFSVCVSGFEMPQETLPVHFLQDVACQNNLCSKFMQIFSMRHLSKGPRF